MVSPNDHVVMNHQNQTPNKWHMRPCSLHECNGCTVLTEGRANGCSSLQGTVVNIGFFSEQQKLTMKYYQSTKICLTNYRMAFLVQSHDIVPCYGKFNSISGAHLDHHQLKVDMLYRSRKFSGEQ
jgi:hypothetical protein